MHILQILANRGHSSFSVFFFHIYFQLVQRLCKRFGLKCSILSSTSRTPLPKITNLATGSFRQRATSSSLTSPRDSFLPAPSPSRRRWKFSKKNRPQAESAGWPTPASASRLRNPTLFCSNEAVEAISVAISRAKSPEAAEWCANLLGAILTPSNESAKQFFGTPQFRDAVKTLHDHAYESGTAGKSAYDKIIAIVEQELVALVEKNFFLVGIFMINHNKTLKYFSFYYILFYFFLF